MINLDNITSIEVCTTILGKLQNKRSDHDYEKTQAGRDKNHVQQTASSLPSEINRKSIMLQNYQTSLASMPEGPERVDLQTEVKRLEVQISDLNKRLEKNGQDELFTANLEIELNEAMVNILDTYIPLVETKLAELTAASGS